MPKTTESVLQERLKINNMYYRVGDTVAIADDELDMEDGIPLSKLAGERVTIKEVDEEKKTYRVEELAYEFIDADFNSNSCILKDEG